MANIKKALKAGFDAMVGDAKDTASGRRYRTSWKAIKCTQCDGERFKAGSAMLNTQGMTLVGLDWLNRTAIVLVCVRCSAIHWFAETVTELDDVDESGSL